MTLIEIPQEQPPIEFVDYFYDEAPASKKLDPSIDKYEFAAEKMKIKNIHAFLKKTRLELKDRAKPWINDYIEHVTEEKVASELLLKIRNGDHPKVDIDVDDRGKMYFCVKCIECEKDVKVSMKRLRTPGSTTLGCYVRQNYDKHMIRVHLQVKVDSYAQIPNFL